MNKYQIRESKLIRRRYFADNCKYWDMIESNRTENGLPQWTFDFISVHKNRRNGTYSLLAPTLLIRENSRRPRFEQKNFPSMETAKSYALRIALRLKPQYGNIHVVNCCNR